MGSRVELWYVAIIGLLIAIYVAATILIPQPHMPDLELEDCINLGQGDSRYTEEYVFFNVECVHDVPIDVEDLSVEFVLTSDGMQIGTGTSNRSESVNEPAFPEWRIFRNVTVPHLGYPKDSLGFVVTLYYKGEKVDRYVYDRIPGFAD